MRIGVSGWQGRAWVDRPAALENFEVKVIAGCASGGPLEADWLPDDHMRSVGRGERLEVTVEVCPAAGIEDAVRAEAAGPPRRVPAGDGRPQRLMKNSIRDRDHHGCGRAHDVDTAMWVLPRGVPNPWLTYMFGQFIGAPTTNPLSAAQELTVSAWQGGPLPTPISDAVAATSPLPTDRATIPATTEHAPQPMQGTRQYAPKRRPVRREDPPPTAEVSAAAERTLESAAPIAAGSATLQPANAATGRDLGSGDDCASASKAGPGTIATTVRSPPDSSTARP